MKKVVKQFPCKEGLSWLRVFSSVGDYKRESNENRDFISQNDKRTMSDIDGIKGEQNHQLRRKINSGKWTQYKLIGSCC